MCPDLFRYSNSFEPILLEGMTATLFAAGLPSEGYNVECLAVGALPEYYKDFGALTAATWDSDNEDSNLEMSPMELAQCRMRIQDDIICRLKNTAAVQQWRTKDTVFYLPQFPSEEGQDWLKTYLWKASEFLVWENTTPRFDFYSTIALTTSRVLFSGWRFKMKKIATPGRIKILINEWPSGR